MTTRLHELLAVLGDRESQTAAILNEATHTFKARPELFFETLRRLDLFREEDKSLETPAEYVAMTGTVPDKMQYVATSVVRLWDVLLAQERTNQAARADLVLEGEAIAKDLPATFLLNMEKRLKALRDVYLLIPTLPPGKDWVKDEQKGKYVYHSDKPETQYKTKKTTEFRVLYQATKEHPAQIEKWADTKEIGLYTKDIWCSMISSAEKSELLARLDKIISAVKQARQRANAQEVVKDRIGATLFDYIHGDLIRSE